MMGVQNSFMSAWDYYSQFYNIDYDRIHIDFMPRGAKVSDFQLDLNGCNHRIMILIFEHDPSISDLDYKFIYALQSDGHNDNAVEFDVGTINAILQKILGRDIEKQREGNKDES